MALSALLSACATTAPRQGAVQPTASLEVANRTALDWEVSTDGWRVGLVPSGERRVFRALRPGTHRLSTWADGYHSKQHTLTLRPGQRASWTLMPPEGRGAPLPDPPPLGTVRIENPSRFQLELRLDEGHPRGVEPGDTLVLRDISAGDHRVELRVPNTPYRRSVSVQVHGDRVTALALGPGAGIITVKNTTGEPVRVFVDGRPAALVPNGAAAPLPPVIAGLHALSAKGERSKKQYFFRLQVEAQSQRTWDLTASEGKLRLTNRTGEAAKLSIDGVAHGMLANAKTREWSDIPLGSRMVIAEGTQSGYRWTARLAITAGHTVTWTLRDNVGTLLVSNQRRESVEIRHQRQLLATLSPGETATFTELPGGEQRIAALGVTSHALTHKTVTVGPARSAEWIITGPMARIHVRNQTVESVVVYAEQRPLGRVPAHGERLFTQVPPGTRLMEARSQRSGKITRAKLHLDAAEMTTWDVADSAGLVRIDNQSGEDLLTPPTLQPQAKQIKRGRHLTFRLPVGEPRLLLIGARSGQRYDQRLKITTAARVTWVVEAMHGILEVFNRTAEDFRVRVDGDAPVIVAAGHHERIRLRVGSHELVAVGVDSGEARQGSAQVRGGTTHPWEIRRRLGYVQISNTSFEPVELRRDGQVIGIVAAESARSYGPWPPGKVPLTAQGRISHAIYEVSLEVVPGRVEAWEIIPARGAVLAKNDRAEAVRLLLDGRGVGHVAAHAQRRIELPVGPHLFELIGRDSMAIFRTRLHVRHDRTVTVTAPSGPARLVVTNRLPTAVSISIDGLARGVVGAGQTARFALPAIGRVVALAAAGEAGPTWHRRLNVVDDREVRWEILP